MKRNKRIRRLSQDFEDKHLKTSSYRPKIQHASFQPTAGAADRSAHSAGPCLEELLGRWVEGARGQQEAELQTKGTNKCPKMKAKKVPGVALDIQRSRF